MPIKLMPRALVTGVSGFVGSNLVNGLIQEGWDVSVIVRPTSSMKLLLGTSNKIDVYETTGAPECILDIVGRAKPDVVFHLASLVVNEHRSDEAVPLIESNITFGTQLLEAMAFHGVERFVNTGTYWEHYENREYSPVNLYAATKHAFQNILQYYVEAKGINAVTLKLFDLYGSNDPRPKILNLLMKAIKTGKTLSMSPGDQKIDLVHIDDVVAAYLAVAKRLNEGDVLGHEVYGVRTGKKVSLKELVEILESLTGKNLCIEWGGRPYRQREVMVPTDRLATPPNWNVSVGIDEGLSRIAGTQCLNAPL